MELVIRSFFIKYVLFITCIWCCALIYSLTCYPEGSILFLPSDRFMDFIHYAKQSYYLGNSDSFFRNKQAYPFVLGPPTIIFYSMFSKLFHPHYFLAAYLYLTAIIFTIIFMLRFLTWKIKKENGDETFFWISASLTILFFPLWFLLDRANPEGFVFIALVIGFLLVNKKDGLISAVFVGLAASMKYFPGIFLFWFFYRKQYKAFWLSMLAGAFFTLVGLLIIGPTPLKAFLQIFSDMEQFDKAYHLGITPPHELRFYHSVFAIIKNILIYCGNDQYIKSAYDLYILFAPAILSYLIWTVRHIPPINQLFALVIMMVVFAPLSADYRLIHVLIPVVAFIYFIVTRREKETVPNSIIIAILSPLMLIIIPTSQLHFGGLWVGGIIKFVGLIWLMVAAIKNPIHSPTLWSETTSESK